MSIASIFSLIFVFLSFICALIAISLEIKKWNKGYCKCGNKWRLYWIDPYSRIYECQECDSIIDIISNVDKRCRDGR